MLWIRGPSTKLCQRGVGLVSHFLGNRRFVAHDHPVDISAIAGNRFLRRVLQNEIIMGNEKSQRKKKKITSGEYTAA